MTQPSDRINASADRVVNLPLDKEALAVLALNDAAVRSKQGQFFYLPEVAPVKGKWANGEVHSETRVPNLLYAHHLWAEHEAIAYWQFDDANRYLYIQGHIAALLRQTDVISISLVLQDTKVSSLSWPGDSIAAIVIYGPGQPWYKMSWMSEWVAKASMDKTAKTYTISMYQPSNSKKKFKYTQSGNAMGKTCGTDDVPSRLREMLRQPVDGEVKSLWVSGADVAMALLHEATGGERGAEMAKALLHEAAGEEGGAAPRKEGRCQSSLPVDTY